MLSNFWIIHHFQCISLTSCHFSDSWLFFCSCVRVLDRTLHNTSVGLWWSTMVSSFSFICVTGRVTIATNNKIMNEKNDWIYREMCFTPWSTPWHLRTNFYDTINDFNISIVSLLFIYLCMCQHSSSTCIWSLYLSADHIFIDKNHLNRETLN
jgi:hypothetical protein